MKKFITILLMAAFFQLSAQETELKPTDTDALLTIKVTDLEGNPTQGDHITLTGKTGEESFSGVTGPDGQFKILIPKGDKYVVKYKTWGDDFEYSELDVPEFDGKLKFDFTIKYELPKVYTLENVYFDTGKATLRAESNKALNHLAEVMGHKKYMKIEVAGHTDSVGDEKQNQALSENRAKSVRDYLIEKSIDSSRVVAVGYGESKPIASNDTDEGRQKNRRTVVKILAE